MAPLAAAAATAVIGIMASMLQGKTLVCLVDYVFMTSCHRSLVPIHSPIAKSPSLFQGTTALRRAHASAWSPFCRSVSSARNWPSGSSPTPCATCFAGRAPPHPASRSSCQVCTAASVHSSPLQAQIWCTRELTDCSLHVSRTVAVSLICLKVTAHVANCSTWATGRGQIADALAGRKGAVQRGPAGGQPVPRTCLPGLQGKNLTQPPACDC